MSCRLLWRLRNLLFGHPPRMCVVSLTLRVDSCSSCWHTLHWGLSRIPYWYRRPPLAVNPSCCQPPLAVNLRRATLSTLRIVLSTPPCCQLGGVKVDSKGVSPLLSFSCHQCAPFASQYPPQGTPIVRSARCAGVVYNLLISPVEEGLSM